MNIRNTAGGLRADWPPPGDRHLRLVKPPFENGFDQHLAQSKRKWKNILNIWAGTTLKAVGGLLSAGCSLGCFIFAALVLLTLVGGAWRIFAAVWGL